MATAIVLKGFDYRKQSAHAATRAQWRELFDANSASGGYHKFVGGDRTAFDKRGRMQFEVYEPTEGAQ